MTDPTSRMPLPGEPRQDADDAAAAAETGTFGAAPSGAPSPPPPPSAPPPAPMPAVTGGPPPPSAASSWRPPRTDEGRIAGVVFGLILLGIGLWFFAEITLGLAMPSISWDQVWPIILIVIGVWIVLSSRRRTPG